MQYEFFIASRWRNKDSVVELANKIQQKGHTVYNFIDGDGATYQLKDHENKYTPDEFMNMFEKLPDWINDPKVKEVFDCDIEALKSSEKLILLLPGGKSSHMEAGIAYGMGKKCIVIGELQETESLYFIFSEFYQSIDSFVSSLT